MTHYRQWGRWLAAALSLLTAVLLSVQAGAAPKGSRWGPNYFPNYEVTAHTGEKFKFYDDLIEDKIVLINFIYTNCTDICPLVTARLLRVQDAFKGRLGKDVFIYSITLDPENDTPEVLNEHAEAFGTQPGWLFLTGDPVELDLIRHKLGERSRYLGEHRMDAVIGNDATGEWSRTSIFGDIKRTIITLREMDPVYRATVQKIDSSYESAKVLQIDDRPGEGLFKKACASCHTIGNGVRIGPDLAGVTDRRQEEWLLNYIMAPDEMRAKRDPTALALDKGFPAVPMPNLGLSKTDVGDLIAYLKSRKTALPRKKTSLGKPQPASVN